MLKKVKNTKLATKISIFSGLVVLVGIIVLCALILVKIRTSSYEQAVQIATETSRHYAAEVTGEIDLTKVQVQGVADYINMVKGHNEVSREVVIDKLKYFLDKNSSMLDLYTLWEPQAFDGKDNNYINKEGHDSTGRFIPVLVRNNDEVTLEVAGDYETDGAGDYYLVPKKTKQTYITEPYNYTFADGRTVALISIVIPILDDSGNFIGIVGADIDLTDFQNYVLSATPMDGYTGICTGKGNFIAHAKKPEYITTSWLEKDSTAAISIEKVAKGESFMEVQKNLATGESSLKVFEPILVDGQDNYWSFISVIPLENIYKEYTTILEETIIITILLILFIIAIMFIIINHTIKPVIVISKHLNLFADADFTKQLPDAYMYRGDEIGILAKAMNTMQHSIREMIGNVIDESSNTKRIVENTSKYMNDLSVGMKDISATTQELSAGMEETAAYTEDINSTTNEIEKSIEALAQKAQEGAVSAHEISKRAEELMTNAGNSRQNAFTVTNQINENLKKAIEQSKAVEQINELSDAILQITSQTNLLALNAAIEAARAGEVGKGFAVVAEEIRNLAENSKGTVNEIQNITKVVLEAVKNLSHGSEQVLDFINTQVVKDYEEMEQTGVLYSGDAELIDELVSEFSTTSEEVLASVMNMIKSIHEVTTITNEGANGVAHITQNVVEIVENADYVLEQVDSSKEASEKLMTIASQFKV